MKIAKSTTLSLCASTLLSLPMQGQQRVVGGDRAKVFALDGNSSMQETLSGAENPNISGSCTNQGSSVWFPDLRRDESIVDIDILVKF